MTGARSVGAVLVVVAVLVVAQFVVRRVLVETDAPLCRATAGSIAADAVP